MSTTAKSTLRGRIENVVTAVIVIAGVAWVATGGAKKSGSAESAAPVRSASRELTQPTRIGGIPCTTGRILWFPEAKRVEQCTLSDTATVGRIAFPAGTQLVLNVEGGLRYVFLPEAGALIQGHRCRGATGQSWMTNFREDGTLEQCWLAADEEIRGVPCAAAAAGDPAAGVATKFHRNGAVVSCRLAKEITASGMTLAKGTRVQLDSMGTIASAQRR